MRRSWLILAALMLNLPSLVRAENIAVSIDVSAARAVLDAVRNPQLTTNEALKIARLPGNQGLIRKAQSYGRTASDALFAQALVAAAHQDADFKDAGQFQFDGVRKRAVPTEEALARLNDPGVRLLDKVRARLAMFAPGELKGAVVGYLVAGGTSGGFAFGDPEFYLNLDYYPSAVLAATIMEHELFHAVQALAASARKPAPTEAACVAATAHAGDVASLFASLSDEGTASYVGDILALPERGGDDATARERARFGRNVAMVERSITQLELSVHGLTTGAAVSPDDVYALNFYGDEVLYALGYVMARAIAQERGSGAVGALIGLPGAEFVKTYAGLKGYGKTDKVPALKPATLRWAEKLSACAGGR